jgi:uncharacterized SAM-binding protein YcdF (DUF218 family)
MTEVETNAKIIWDYMLMHHELKPMDAIFALGTADLRVAERATDLFLEGYGTYLLVAGKNGASHGKKVWFEESEAERFAAVARERGVPEDKIIIEKESTNTGENILFMRKLLAERGLKLGSFILVQKPYMERRCYATFRAQWPEAACVVTSPQVPFSEYARDPKYSYRWIDVMTGDLQRIKEYPKTGFQIPQEIPQKVETAYQKLVDLGYTKLLIKT